MLVLGEKKIILVFDFWSLEAEGADGGDFLLLSMLKLYGIFLNP